MSGNNEHEVNPFDEDDDFLMDSDSADHFESSEDEDDFGNSGHESLEEPLDDFEEEDDVAPAKAEEAPKKSGSGPLLIAGLASLIMLGAGGYVLNQQFSSGSDETAYAREPLDKTPPPKMAADFGSLEQTVSAQEQVTVPSQSTGFDEPTAGITPAPETVVITPPEISKQEFDDLKSMVSKNADLISKLTEKLSSVQKPTSGISKQDLDMAIKSLKDSNSGFIARLERVEELTADEAKELADKERAEAALAEKVAVYGERDRLPNLMVIEASSDGAIAIVKKVTDGRVFALFEGERVMTDKGRFLVTKIVEDGMGVWVGDDYFIDDKEPPVIKAPVARTQPVARKAAERKPAEPAKPEISSEYKVNAVFNAGKSFGIVNSRGDTALYEVGDTVPGLGQIKGVNDKGQLEVGAKLIAPSY